MYLKVTEFFFDREAVIKAAGKARVKVLSKRGAFIRRRAQTSMRYKKKRDAKGKTIASAPGSPPLAHKSEGALLRKLLFFSYDFSSDSTVIGPTAIGKGEAPALNEFGGYALRGGKVAKYPERAFMQPALEAETPAMPKDWQNQIGA